MKITLYVGRDCSLCDALKADLLSLQPEIGFDFIVKNIDEAPEQVQRYRAVIPLLDIDGSSLLTSPISYDDLFAGIEAVAA